jgi:hypothetical protein
MRLRCDKAELRGILDAATAHFAPFGHAFLLRCKT